METFPTLTDDHFESIYNQFIDLHGLTAIIENMVVNLKIML